MSTFIGITCYDENGREGGNVRRLRRSDLEQAVKSLPNFDLVNEDGSWGIKLPGLDMVAVLEGGGTLSCQIDNQTEVDHLIEQLRLWQLHYPTRR
jgi:hypothetical protein